MFAPVTILWNPGSDFQRIDMRWAEGECRAYDRRDKGERVGFPEGCTRRAGASQLLPAHSSVV